MRKGWEADVAVEDTVLRRFVYAYADRTASMATALGGRTRRDDDASFADLGSAFFYDNAVTLLHPATADGVADIVRRAYAFYPPDRPWALLSAFPLGDLTNLGLTLDGYPPLMFRPAGGTAPSPVAGLRIERVRDEAGLDVVHKVLVDGYPDISDGGPIAGPASLDSVAFFVGYVDETPVSVAGSVVSHGLVEVDWVCTLPAYQGRGFGTALTWAATSVDPSLPAVLIASEDGRGIYEKLGYVSLLRTALWTFLPEWSRPL